MVSVIIPNHNEPGIMEFIDKVEDVIQEGQIIIGCDPEGKGKGYAIRQALSEVKEDLVCILDGDGDIEPRMILRLLPFLDEYDIVVGRKIHRSILSRRILTRLSRFYIWAMFGLLIDTQTGIKLYKREALLDFKCDGFAYDIELLVKAKRKGFKIVEVPVEACITRRVKMICLWRTFLESLKVYVDLKRKK